MKKSIVLMILLLTLNGCSISSRYLPTVVTEYLPAVKTEVPSELLEVEPAPDATILKDVEICKGEKQIKQFGLELLHSDYTNRQKLLAIKELLQ